MKEFLENFFDGIGVWFKLSLIPVLSVLVSSVLAVVIPAAILYVFFSFVLGIPN
jgi:hypothetical protein